MLVSVRRSVSCSDRFRACHRTRGPDQRISAERATAPAGSAAWSSPAPATVATARRAKAARQAVAASDRAPRDGQEPLLAFAELPGRGSQPAAQVGNRRATGHRIATGDIRSSSPGEM
jgi:hypothetical protein